MHNVTLTPLRISEAFCEELSCREIEINFPVNTLRVGTQNNLHLGHKDGVGHCDSTDENALQKRQDTDTHNKINDGKQPRPPVEEYTIVIM